MGLPISSHAYSKLRERNILPGQADDVLAEPEWCGTRRDGSQVFSRNGIAVIVKNGVIATAYFLRNGANHGAG